MLGRVMIEAKRAQTEAAVLEANSSFYRAFTRADYPAMARLWAEQAPVACFHPGAPVIAGRRPVLESWRQILRAPLPMRCDHAMVHLLGDTAFVTCYEASGNRPAHLAATNGFVLEDGSWRMVIHQAGPLSNPLPRPAPPSAAN
jgi:ketosteroid isomerase-like protein